MLSSTEKEIYAGRIKMFIEKSAPCSVGSARELMSMCSIPYNNVTKCFVGRLIRKEKYLSRVIEHSLKVGRSREYVLVQP